MEDAGFDRDRQEYVSRRRRRPSPETCRNFLDLVSLGMPKDGAARLVGSTASRMRAEAVRNSQFRGWLEEAERRGAKGGEAHQATLRGVLHEVALGHVLGTREEHPKAFEALKILAETHLEEMQWRRQKQVEHGQKAPFEFIIGQRVPEEVLLAMPPEERRLLLEAVRMLEAGQQRLRLIEGGAVDGEGS